MAAYPIPSETTTLQNYAAVREPLRLANSSNRNETRRLVKGPPQETKFVHVRKGDFPGSEMAQPADKKAKHSERADLSASPSSQSDANAEKQINDAIDKLENPDKLGDPLTRHYQRMILLGTIARNIDKTDSNFQIKTGSKLRKIVTHVTNDYLAQCRKPETTLFEKLVLVHKVGELIAESTDCLAAVGQIDKAFSKFGITARTELYHMFAPIMETFVREAADPTISSEDRHGITETIHGELNDFVKTMIRIDPSDSNFRTKVENRLVSMLTHSTHEFDKPNSSHEARIAHAGMIGACFRALGQINPNKYSAQTAKGIAEQLLSKVTQRMMKNPESFQIDKNGHSDIINQYTATINMIDPGTTENGKPKGGKTEAKAEARRNHQPS